MPCFRCLPLILPLLWMLTAAPGRGQELTRPEQVLALEAVDAGKHPRPVRMAGVVIEVAVRKNGFTLHQGTRSVGIQLADGMACPALGETVEVEGLTFTHNVAGRAHPRVQASRVLVTGTTSLPVPRRVTIEELNRFGNFDQWVAVEGQVLRWKFRRTTRELLVVVTGSDGWTTVTVQTPGLPEWVGQLMGARLRLTGINGGENTYDAFEAMLTPSPAQVEVLKPGREDPFAGPVSSMQDIAERRAESGVQLKVMGTVLARFGERVIYLRGSDGAQCNLLATAWPRLSTDEDYHDAGTLPALKPGDEVEMIGTPMERSSDRELHQFALSFCHVRVIGSQPPPEPITTTLEEIAAGKWSHDLVSVRGKLTRKEQMPMERREWRTTLLLEAGDASIPLYCQSKGLNSFDTLKVDDELLVMALVDRLTPVGPRQLRLISAGDVKSLGVSPAVRSRQLLTWGASALAVLAVFGGWIRALRKSNRAKTEEADLLEQRVRERTAELSQAQTDLTRALAQERELGDLKSRFVTMVSHEFRTPLGIIMSAIELVRHYDDRLPPEQRKELQQDIFNSTQHMAGMMEQMLVLGRVEAGKLACQPTSCDLDTLAGKLTDECLSATNQKCVIRWRAEGDLSGAMADEALLRHIFSNLIHNAVKYSPAAGEVVFTVRREGDRAVFKVTDHGIGIPQDDLKDLFEAFHRGRNVGEIPGTGLGLVIVKRCIDLHGGTLELDSVVGQGTTFTVDLPLFPGRGGAA